MSVDDKKIIWKIESIIIIFDNIVLFLIKNFIYDMPIINLTLNYGD